MKHKNTFSRCAMHLAMVLSMVAAIATPAMASDTSTWSGWASSLWQRATEYMGSYLPTTESIANVGLSIGQTVSRGASSVAEVVKEHPWMTTGALLTAGGAGYLARKWWQAKQQDVLKQQQKALYHSVANKAVEQNLSETQQIQRLKSESHGLKNEDLDKKFAPEETKNLIDDNQENNDYGSCAMWGRRLRDEKGMEDEECIRLNFDGEENHNFFGVFDGHHGKNASKYVARRLVEQIAEKLNEHVQSLNGAHFNYSDTNKIFPILFSAALATDKELLECQTNENKTYNDKSGTCAIVACQFNQDLYVMNVGDSRAVLCSNGDEVALSKDHKAEGSLDPDSEYQRIIRTGTRIEGYRGRALIKGKWQQVDIFRVGDEGLALSRAFGDPVTKGRHKGAIIPDPEIQYHKIDNQDEFLILACDGIWDVCSNEEAVTLVKTALDEGKSPREAATALCKQAYDWGSQDNLSAIVIRFKK